MKEYEFTLKFAVPDGDAQDLPELLYENGCDDALIGMGQPGRLALIFNREADSALEAVMSALSNVKQGIPQAELIEASPDLVGLTDIAKIIGVSRQYMRKLMIAQRASFPHPVHEGKTCIWHLFEILEWFANSQAKPIESTLLEISKVSMQCNFSRSIPKQDPNISDKLLDIAI